MIERNSAVISKEKSKDFQNFISKNVKNEKYWNEIRKSASQKVDKEKIDDLFKG